MSERELTDLVQWQALPPVLRTITVPILSPKPLEHFRLPVVCNEHALVPVHWYRQRTTACIGLANGCEGCREGKGTDTKLYFGVWRPDQDRLYAAELPAGAIGMVWGTVDRYPGRLREWVLLLGRPSKHKQGRVTAHLRPMDQFERREWKLPPEWNLREGLTKVWVNLHDRERPDTMTRDEYKEGP